MKYFKNLFFSMSLLGLLVFIGCGGDEATGPEIDYSREQEIAEKAVSVYNNFSDSLGIRKALHQVVDTLNKIEEVEKASMGADSISVWWNISDGYSYVLPTITAASYIDSSGRNSDNTRPHIIPHSIWLSQSRHATHNEKALVLSPFYWDFVFIGLKLENETDSVATLLNSVGYNTTYKRNEQKTDQNISLEDFKHFDEYGVVEIITHGGVNPQGKVGLSTDVDVTEDLRDEYELLLQYGHLVIDAKTNTFIVMPGWFDDCYPEPIENTLFNINACMSLYNQSLASEITGEGSVYFGWDYSVHINAATKTGTDLFYQLIVKGLNAGDAWQEVLSNGNGVYDPFFPWLSLVNYTYYQGLGPPADGLELKLVDNGGVTSDPPNPPSVPSGPDNGYVDSTYSFTSSATDPDGDSVAYIFDWGTTCSPLSEYVPSGTSVSMDHSWSSVGTYTVKVKARDKNGAESGWSNGLSIEISGSVPPTDMIAYYPFNGSANDVSGNGNDGVVHGATLTSDRFGSANSSYSFEGKDNYITIPEFPELPTSNDPFTICLWTYIDNQSPSPFRFYRWGSDETGMSAVDEWNAFSFVDTSYTAFDEYDGLVHTFYGVTYTEDTWIEIPELQRDTWFHVTVTYDGSTVKIYFNGDLKKTHSDDANVYSSDIIIGPHGLHVPDTTYPSNRIDDIRLYDKCLSNSEILGIYESESP